MNIDTFTEELNSECHELFESFINGNISHVMEELEKMSSFKAAMIVVFFHTWMPKQDWINFEQACLRRIYEMA